MSHQPFDDRDGHIWLDGQLVPWREANVHVLTHGLHYASSVFEGERAYGGRVFKLYEHTARLAKSAAILGFELPFTVDELVEATREVIRANEISDGYVRPLAWRGPEDMGIAAPKTKIHVAIAAWPVFSPFKSGVKERGLRLFPSSWARPAPHTLPVHAKASGTYMIGTLSRQEADKNGYDDALLLDYRGFVAEATGANLFVVKNGAITTPIPDCFLNGITRQVIIEEARQLGFDVVEKHVTLAELDDADEIFLTGTAYEITGVRAIGERTFEIGEVTKKLARHYDALVREKPVAAVASGPSATSAT